jgi:periplasmic protein TonB
VSVVRNSLFPYLVVSIAFHLLLVFTWGNRPMRPPPMEEILVKLLPPPAQEKPAARAGSPAPQSTPKAARENTRERSERAELPPGQHAKIDRPGAEATPRKPAVQKKPSEKTAAEKPQPTPDFETSNDDIAMVDRSASSLKELLPPLYRDYSDTRNNDSKPVRLDSRDPRYVEYLQGVKHALDLAWSDPSVARSAVKPFGIDGKLVVRFTRSESGDLEELYITRTSGYAVLDQEALRVVAAAAPHFGHVPRTFGKRPIDVTFIYEKDNVTYSFAPR